MPVPTTLTLAISSSTTNSRALISGKMLVMVSDARGKSLFGQVKLISVTPSSETFWMIMSTETFAAARRENTLAATPDMSGTPRRVTLTSEVSWAMPVTTASSISSVPSIT